MKENTKPQISFNPGFIFKALLEKKSLIFKNINKVSTEVFERFNELFTTERTLNLNEDIYGKFFSQDSKSKVINIKSFGDIQIIATCPENSIQSISESILSRFSVIYVEEHGNEMKEMFINRYSEERRYNINNYIKRFHNY